MFDILILGGGMAGSCAALRLLSLGYRVAMVEKETFPRDQVGESLSPGVWNIFRYLQAEHLLTQLGYLHELPARVIWETREPALISPQQRGPGVMVSRARLDADLLELARQRGLEVFQPAKFESCRETQSGWQARIRQAHGEKLLEATFILDARGRSGTGADQRILTSTPTVALWTHLPAGQWLRETRIEALEQGWLWGSPMPDGRYRVMAFTDPTGLKQASTGSAFEKLVSKGVLFNTALESIVEPVQTCLALTYCHHAPWQNNYLRIGEAAFSLDPLSSTGVEKAMRFSLQAVIAVNTVLRSGEAEMAKTFYEDRLVEAVATHTRWTSGYYAQAWPGETFSFWKERSAGVLKADKNYSQFFNKLAAQLADTPAPAEKPPSREYRLQETLYALWSARMKVSSELSYVPLPCVVGDHLEQKTAIRHPQLDREMAYLDQVEIAPLLLTVHHSGTFGDIVNQWSQRIGFDRAARMAICLWDMKVLCEE